MRNIPFSPPNITDQEINEVVDALKSGWITTGPKTKQFEKDIADYCNTKKAVALNSATAGMELTLRLLGVGPGDEVITSAYTYTASASVIHHVGAKIILVDIQDDKPEMNYEALEDAITENTKVIIPVDIAGIMCDYDKIFQIVEKKKNLFKPTNKYQESIGRIAVMADAAHSFGAQYKGKRSGSVADFTVFSFHAVKNLTTAEGGAVTWSNIKGINEDEIYNEYMLLALHGQNKDALSKSKAGDWEYDIISPLYKMNMTDIHAAIGLSQLRRYQQMLDDRANLVNYYTKSLSKFENIMILEHPMKETKSSFHLFFTRIKGFNEQKRNEFIEKLALRGISTNVHYKPLPLLSAYKKLGFDIKDYPNSVIYYENMVTLPLHNLLTHEDIDYIVNNIEEIIQEDIKWF